MTDIDQFESVFKAADKTVFSHQAVGIQSVLVVTDLPQEAADRFAARLQSFLSALAGQPAVKWHTVTGNRYDRVGQLLAIVEEAEPDLICTYRNLRIPATEYPYSLGVYVDVLTQATTVPVMLLPHPESASHRPDLLQGTKTVMAITDHLTGDHRLVNYGVRFTARDGTLLLTHVEDQATLDRYMDTIARIPAINTDVARTALLQQLLKQPKDYIESCRRELAGAALPITVEMIVTLGHQLIDCKHLVQEHQVDLLVLNTKDEDQLAMHGLAYPLSIELRETPLLLL